MYHCREGIRIHNLCKKKDEDLFALSYFSLASILNEIGACDEARGIIMEFMGPRMMAVFQDDHHIAYAMDVLASINLAKSNYNAALRIGQQSLEKKINLWKLCHLERAKTIYGMREFV